MLRSRSLLLALVALALSPASAAAFPTPIAPGSTLILSGTDGLDAALPAPSNNGWVTSHGSLSDDGHYVAFESGADGLVAGDDDRVSNIYVKDRITGAVTLAARADGVDGEVSHGHCFDPTISDDGTRVAFLCRDALDPVDGNNAMDVYARDLTTGTTWLVSRISGSQGAVANSDSYEPMISGDGSVVVFSSGATNLDPADTAVHSDVFRRELEGGQSTTLVSRRDGAGGEVGGKDSARPSVSDDGDTVAFESDATNLTAKLDGNGYRDIYVRDTIAGTTVLASAPELEITATGNGFSGSPVISGQPVAGQYYVAFTSYASNLGPADTDSVSDVYRRAVNNGAVVLVSRRQDGTPITAHTWSGGIDDSGARIAFSTQDHADPAHVNSESAAYVRDIGSGTTELLSRSGDTGPQLTTDAGGVAVSGNGLVFAWDGEGAGATPDADPEVGNAYVRDLSPRGTELLVRPAGSEPFINAGGYARLSRRGNTMSADGMRVVFAARRGELRDRQAWVRDVRTGALILASRADGSEGAPSARTRDAAISADGNRVAFVTPAPLDPADTDGENSVYVRDLEAGRTFLASRADGAGGANADASASMPALDGDGSRVSFLTSATNLGDGDTSANADFHVRDLATGRTLLGSAGTGNAQAAALDRSGRFLAFDSNADDIGDGDADAVVDVHLRDLETGSLRLVSALPGGGKGSLGSSFAPTISADGSIVAFVSQSPTLVGGNGLKYHVVVRDLARDTLIVADRADGPEGAILDDSADEISLSGDGRKVAWSTGARYGLPGSGLAFGQVHVRDLATGRTVLASRSNGVDGLPAAHNVFAPALSDDGACVAFLTAAPLAPGAGSDFEQVYLRAVAPGCGPATDAPGQGPGGEPDTTAPVLSGARLTRSRFAVAARATALVAAVRRGTVLRFTSSEAGALRIKVQRRVPGVRKGGRCVAAKHRPARSTCALHRRVGVLARTIAGGAGKVRFSGRLGRKALRPGRYRLVLRATDAAGNGSAKVKLAFRVVG